MKTAQFYYQQKEASEKKAIDIHRFGNQKGLNTTRKTMAIISMVGISLTIL